MTDLDDALAAFEAEIGGLEYKEKKESDNADIANDNSNIVADKRNDDAAADDSAVSNARKRHRDDNDQNDSSLPLKQPRISTAVVVESPAIHHIAPRALVTRTAPPVRAPPTSTAASASATAIINAYNAQAATPPSSCSPVVANTHTVRKAGGVVWSDDSLADFPANDFRLFIGDLSDDVNDAVLSRVFAQFPSFAMARVIRDKRTNKSKGYGFVSYTESASALRALRELNGIYCGNRPIKVRKSEWTKRTYETNKTLALHKRS